MTPTQAAHTGTEPETLRRHSTTAYTQDAYQHVLPGMQRDAARRFRERLNRIKTPTNDGQTGKENAS